MKILKAVIVVAMIAAAATVAWNSPRGIEWRRQFDINYSCCEFNVLQALRFTIEEAAAGPVYPSEIGQDKWVLGKVFPGVKNGFFLDVGSGHGTIGSNTKALEDLGWTGICIDPFPTHMEGRTCRMETVVVSSTAGQVVKFRTHRALGGIEDTLGKWKSEAAKSPIVEFTTTTLGDVLEGAKAPPFIHFMSLDIEGAELEALKGVPFDKYRFGAMAIEHNDEEPKRTDILKFLEARGYHRTHSFRQDDFYVPR
ncbi:MAG TPA: FkbM family methyltransferase [Vicinamibacterales bacterium]|nr:FkbM family methyltransferase [Vicinamibacterales bacterium]